MGVRKTKPERTQRIFEKLRRAHDKAGRAQLWADVELFDFEGMVYQSALIPANIERVKLQIENVAPYADKIIGYQYPGLMNPPDSKAFAGRADTVDFYREYLKYISAEV